MFDDLNAIVLYITPIRRLQNTTGKTPVFQYCFEPKTYDTYFQNDIPKPVAQEVPTEESVINLQNGFALYSYTNEQDNLRYWLLCLKNKQSRKDNSAGTMAGPVQNDYFAIKPIETLNKLNDVIKIYFESFSMDIKQTTNSISNAINSVGVVGHARSLSAMRSGSSSSSSRLSGFGSGQEGLVSSGAPSNASVGGTVSSDHVLNIRRIIKDCDRIALIIQVCNEMNGTEDFNRLVELVPFRKTFSDFINATTKSLSNVKMSTQQTDSLKIMRASQINRERRVVPWRSSSIKYINNEIFVDVIEETSMVINTLHRKSKHGRVTHYDKGSKKSIAYQSTKGKVDFDSQLSHDSPRLQLKFSTKDPYTKSYHQCVNLDSNNYVNKHELTTSGSLQFVPPDGKFTLMRYNVFKNEQQQAGAGTSSTYSSTNPTQRNAISLDYEDGLGIEQDQFEIKLVVGNNMMKIEEIQGLKIKIFFSHFPQTNEDLKVINSTHGYIEKRSKNDSDIFFYEWVFTSDELRKLIVGSMVSIRLYTLSKAFPSRLSMGYTIVGGNLQYNNLQVNKLDVINNAQSLKPFKGVKYTLIMKDCIVNF
ncbi:hypothetical protein ACO0QE_002059 [Hanseniaspora vineae]